MTLENTSLDWDVSVYHSVRASSTELILQPHGARRKSMRAAWLGFVLFEILVLPLITVLPAFVAMIVILALSTTVPGLQNHWITDGVVFLLWAACFGAIAFLTWKVLWTSGYTMFIFDSFARHLAINTVNLLGRKSVRTIPFTQIREAQLQEFAGDGAAMKIFLILEKRKTLGFIHQKKVVLSSFSSEEYRTVSTLTAQKHHQELLLLVRTALGFSTQAIADELRRSPPIPTATELQQEKARSIAAANDGLKAATKMMFSSKEAKQVKIEALRRKTRESPSDPKAWDEFALALAFQKNVSKAELVSAYRRAEELYRDQGDIVQAKRISQTLKGLG